MEKCKSKERRSTDKPQLNVTGQLAMPKEILPWERDLLAVLLEAVDGWFEQNKTDIEVPS
ncbi:MAG: hypothetical protein JW940_14545 [Polyangiaceae bacterium]|nr:hypothetical protein [Polyangiaceae bacterium]